MHLRPELLTGLLVSYYFLIGTFVDNYSRARPFRETEAPPETLPVLPKTGSNE